MDDPKTLALLKMMAEQQLREQVTLNLQAQPMWRTTPMKQHLQQLKTGLSTVAR